MALTEDAKAEIRNAIKIVREDRWEKVHEHLKKGMQTDPPKDLPPNPGPTPPPPNPDPTPPNPEPEPDKEHSKYWGEIIR